MTGNLGASHTTPKDVKMILWFRDVLCNSLSLSLLLLWKKVRECVENARVNVISKEMEMEIKLETTY